MRKKGKQMGNSDIFKRLKNIKTSRDSAHIPLLVESILELERKVEKLKARLKLAEERLVAQGRRSKR